MGTEKKNIFREHMEKITLEGDALKSSKLNLEKKKKKEDPNMEKHVAEKCLRSIQRREREV